MNNNEYLLFRKLVSNAVISAIPAISIEWNRDPRCCNTRLLNILSDIRLIVAYTENHPLLVESIRSIPINVSNHNCKISVNKRNLQDKILSTIKSACPTLEEIWSNSPNENNSEFQEKLSNITVVLQYTNYHPRFLRFLQDGILK